MVEHNRQNPYMFVRGWLVNLLGSTPQLDFFYLLCSVGLLVHVSAARVHYANVVNTKDKHSIDSLVTLIQILLSEFGIILGMNTAFSASENYRGLRLPNRSCV